MKTTSKLKTPSKSKRMKPWNELTQEQKTERVKAGLGKYASVLSGGVDEFLRDKHEDIEREEQKFQAQYAGL